MSLYRRQICLAITAACLIYVGISSAQTEAQPRFSDREEIESLRSVASRVLNRPLGGDAEFRSAANVIGFQSNELLFNHRLDSRTYFFQDFRKYKEEGQGGSSNDELLKRVRELLRLLDVPAGEMGEQKVLQERSRVGEREPSGHIRLEEVQYGPQWARVTRQVEGIPVFSSRALFKFTGEDGSLRFFEVHWPYIPQEVLREAHRLDYKVKSGWKPPRVAEAEVETVEAGIVHSPAIGFVMDVYPVVRVIYKPEKVGAGKKAVRYYDRAGLILPFPRQFAEKIPEQPQPKREAPHSEEQKQR